VAIALPLAALVAAAALNIGLWGAPGPVLSDLGWSGFALAFALRLVNPLDGPIGEEPGWRGYALPPHAGDLVALGRSVILGVLVAGWHLPLVATGDLGRRRAAGDVRDHHCLRLAFNHTNGSVLLTVLFHVAQS
jgi:hypothetical protein